MFHAPPRAGLTRPHANQRPSPAKACGWGWGPRASDFSRSSPRAAPTFLICPSSPASQNMLPSGVCRNEISCSGNLFSLMSGNSSLRPGSKISAEGRHCSTRTHRSAGDRKTKDNNKHQREGWRRGIRVAAAARRCGNNAACTWREQATRVNGRRQIVVFDRTWCGAEMRAQYRLSPHKIQSHTQVLHFQASW